MRRLVVAAMLVAGAAGAARADDAIPADVLRKVKQASVFVKIALGPLESRGSGFAIQIDGETVYIVTNEHVVARPNLDGLQSLPPWLRMREGLEFQNLMLTIQKLEQQVSVVFNSGAENEQVLK